MEIFNSVLYFIITIAVLVIIHEFGHFIAAKLSKMRVEAFAVGFGQRLFGWNKVKGFTFGSLPKDIDLGDNTDYRLCLLPLGGYVKIAGMIDESMDKEFLNKEPQPYEFRSAKTSRKLFVISAGVIMNFLLAFLIFWSINFFKGKQHIKTTEVGFLADTSAAYKAGFRTYDKIIAIDGQKVQYWDEIFNLIFIKNMGEDINVNLIRDGKDIDLKIKREMIPTNETEVRTFILPSATKAYLVQVLKDSPAQKAGLKDGDIFLEVNNIKILTDLQLTSILKANPGKELNFKILRNSKDTLSKNITLTSEGKIGVAIANIIDAPIEYKSFGFFESAVESFKDSYSNVLLFFDVIKKVITGKVEFSKAFGGPVKIAQMAGKTAEASFLTFLNFIALLSLSLAIINIIPFPVLDGGHLVIIALEGIIRREISPKVKIAIQNVGFVILLLFMAFIIYNDIINL